MRYLVLALTIFFFQPAYGSSRCDQFFADVTVSVRDSYLKSLDQEIREALREAYGISGITVDETDFDVPLFHTEVADDVFDISTGEVTVRNRPERFQVILDPVATHDNSVRLRRSYGGEGYLYDAVGRRSKYFCRRSFSVSFGWWERSSYGMAPGDLVIINVETRERITTYFPRTVPLGPSPSNFYIELPI